MCSRLRLSNLVNPLTLPCPEAGKHIIVQRSLMRYSRLLQVIKNSVNIFSTSNDDCADSVLPFKEMSDDIPEIMYFHGP